MSENCNRNMKIFRLSLILPLFLDAFRSLNFMPLSPQVPVQRRRLFAQVVVYGGFGFAENIVVIPLAVGIELVNWRFQLRRKPKPVKRRDKRRRVTALQKRLKLPKVVLPATGVIIASATVTAMTAAYILFTRIETEYLMFRRHRASFKRVRHFVRVAVRPRTAC